MCLPVCLSAYVSVCRLSVLAPCVPIRRLSCTAHDIVGSRAGLDQTRAVLVAEPAADEVTIEVEFSSVAGSLSFKLVGEPSPDNPRTGHDVPFDVLKAIANKCSPVHLGA
eukprot:SAG22_NODE_1839_length_3465_cov_17.924540_2_plen_110_part_00